MDKTGVERLLLVVPKKYRNDLKAFCHEGTSGHLGVTKTKDIFSRHFFWPQCYKEIEDYVRSCDRCQRVGKPFDKKKAPMKIVPVIQEVFSKINVDACGPLPVTPSGKRYLLTAMCLSSKYPDAVPVEDITYVTVVDALLQIFSRMGFPKVLQLDQGSSFTSALSTTFLEKFGIKVVHSSVYHPQTLFALRTVTHESTGFTPAELVHGKNLRTPLTLLYEKWLDVEETEGEPVTEYVFYLINRIKRCQELAISKMEEWQQKNKTWYDKKAVKREFRIGDLVLIFATFKSNKLSPHWTGPGTILRKLSETNYVVQLPGEKATSKVYHVNMLKPYYKRPEEVYYLISDLEGENDEEQMEIPCVDSNPNILDLEEMFQDYGESSNMNEDQIAQMKNLIWKYMKCFSNVPGKTELVMHDIKLSEEQSILSKLYRTSPRQNAILKTEIQKMLDLKIIEIGFSDSTSPMILVEAPGLAGYYSRYIPIFSSIAAPLTDSLKGKARKGPITWTKECEEAFDKLKNCLCNYPVLYSPDYQKPFIVETDASDQGMGVVLSQLADNETEKHPIIYLSKKFTSVEKR
ncbi:hypothetical protein JTE90_012632 [Oedothorax gibbosus]|uniref:RNA-directed DNA polymerase n=1 Tax=Oedothorax gibbosus TaxID=931172 RepID=A0AAV6ULI2_9ARAC|nr:hypothetical protein JTE90_012632 [Oedothorax gibbosus]